MPDIHDKHVIFYAARGYRTGQTCSITIYDSIGNTEVNAASMTEMGSTGIYYYNFRPRKRTAYISVMNCSEFPLKAHQVIRVEKQKLSGAVRIPRVKIPDVIWKEKDKSRIFSLLKALPSKFPKPQKLEVKKEIDIEEMFSSLKKEIISKIPKPQGKISTEIFEESLAEYFSSLDSHFKPLRDELGRLIILSDEINVNQKLNVKETSSISPEEDKILLEAKYGT